MEGLEIDRDWLDLQKFKLDKNGFMVYELTKIKNSYNVNSLDEYVKFYMWMWGREGFEDIFYYTPEILKLKI